jgi:hypothetical protein
MTIELIERRGNIKPTVEINPIGGINTDLPSTELENFVSPNSQNVTFHKYTVDSRNGLKVLGDQDNLTGIPTGIWEYIRANQTRYLLVLTTDGFFRYKPATGTWEDLNADDLLTISSNPTDFATGTYFPQGGDDMYIVTNQVDPIMKWEGSESSDAEVLGGLSTGAGDPITIKADIVRTYMDYLILLNTEEDGTRIAQRVRWSDTGKPEVFTGGTSGFSDIISKGAGIKASEMLREILYIYMENSIVAFNWIGGTSVFRWTITVPETGLAASRTVAEFGDFHIFLGYDSVYMFDGTQRLMSISDGRVNEGIINAVNYDNIENAFAVVDKKFGLYSLYLPSGGAYWPLTRWTYDISTQTWAKSEFASTLSGTREDADGNRSGIIGGVLYREFTGEAWEDLVGTWEAQDWRWDSRAIQKDAPRLALTHSGGTKGGVFIDSPLTFNDTTLRVDSFIETKDFQIGDNTRVTQLDFEAVGYSLDIAYSIDEGKNWVNVETVELNQVTMQRYSVFFDVLSERVRFRFRNNTISEGFSLRKFRFWAIPRL